MATRMFGYAVCIAGLIWGLASGVASAPTDTVVPAVHLYDVTQNVTQNGQHKLVEGLTTTFAVGGMVVETRDTIIVPWTGVYEVSASLCFEIGGSTVPAATYETQVYVTGMEARLWEVRSVTGWTPHHVLWGEAPIPTGTSLLRLNAGQSVQLYAWQGSGQLIGVGWNSPPQGRRDNYISLSWVGTL